MELNKVQTLQDLDKHVNKYLECISKPLVKKILGKCVEICMGLNQQRIINLMYICYAKDREGTQEELRKSFSEWLASSNVMGVDGQDKKQEVK